MAAAHGGPDPCDNQGMPRRTDDFRGLAQASRMRLLAEVQREPGLLLRELAERTQLHENTVRDHLVVLEREGLVSRQTNHRGTRGRPPATYHPVADATTNPAAHKRMVRAQQHGDLLRRISPEASRSDLGEDALHQLDVLYEHLDDAGLQPEIDEKSLSVDVVPCPYYSLLDEDQQLVCHVHEQLIKDVLRQIPGPMELTLLQPFTAPDTCRVHLHVSGSRRSE